jgi:hypothetical protein
MKGGPRLSEVFEAEVFFIEVPGNNLFLVEGVDCLTADSDR